MMLDRSYPSQLTVRGKPWWFFTILSMIALACASCGGATQQPSSSRERAMQRPHIIEATKLPLTDSAPPQLDVTPTVPVTTPTPLGVPAIATPRVLQTTTVDDRAVGTGFNQFNYVGSGWDHCTNGCPGPGHTPCALYDGSNTWDNTTGNYVTLTFIGTQIKFYAVLDSSRGTGAISVDGGSETTIDFYKS